MSNLKKLQFKKRIKIKFKIPHMINLTAWVFIVLFIYAACSKLIEYEKFKIQLSKSPVLSGFSAIMAWLVPGLEILISILLASARFQLCAFYASFSLMAIFSCYIVVILNFSYTIPCSCGGILENMSWNQHLWFNIFFTLVAALAVLFYPKMDDKNIIAQ